MVVRRCHNQDPYARVAQPFGRRAGNALRLHCPTLFGTLPPAMHQRRGGGARQLGSQQQQHHHQPRFLAY